MSSRIGGETGLVEVEVVEKVVQFLEALIVVVVGLSAGKNARKSACQQSYRGTT